MLTLAVGTRLGLIEKYLTSIVNNFLSCIFYLYFITLYTFDWNITKELDIFNVGSGKTTFVDWNIYIYFEIVCGAYLQGRHLLSKAVKHNVIYSR